MKNLLLASSFVILSTVAARADEPALQLGIGGHISTYGVYTDQDEAPGAARRAFDFRKDSEVHLKGEVALDHGITAGAHFEFNADREDTLETEESYFYLSSAYGRFNIGEDNGVGYLLQVSAPSADDNIDGVKPEISAFTAANGGLRNYAMDETSYGNKVSYLTPSLSGVQAGVSFTPSLVSSATAGNITVGASGDVDGVTPAVGDDDAGDIGNAWEGAIRYEGSFHALDVTLGAGFLHGALEADNPPFVADDLQSWNAGATIGWGAFSIGAVYLRTNNALENADTDIRVVGVDYKTGPYKFGASYYNSQSEEGIALAGTEEQKIDRWTVGAVYEWGPGMSFRGAVQHQEADNAGAVAGADGAGTQLTFGTQIEF